MYTSLYTFSLHDVLPISSRRRHTRYRYVTGVQTYAVYCLRSEEHTSELQSHSGISYAVVCLKKKKQLRDENAHNYKSVHVVLNPIYQAGLRRDVFLLNIAANPKK